MKKIKTRKFRNKIYKRWKIFGGIVVSFLLVMSVHSVWAGMNDTTILKNQVEGIYAIGFVDGQDHLYYLNMYTANGIPSYCIELGVPVSSLTYHSTDQFKISNLTDEQIRHVQLLSYYGYGYSGHEDRSYYMAAQELIWEYLKGVDIQWTNVLDFHGPTINIDRFKEEILRLVKERKKSISFSYDGNYQFHLGEEVVLEDTSGNLQNYVGDSSSNSKAWVDGNFLHILVGKDHLGEDMVLLRRKEDYSYLSQLYYYDGSQKLISNGNLGNEVVEVPFSVIGANVNVQLFDGETMSSVVTGQGTLEGALYELYNEENDLVDTIETDSFGKILIEDVAYGKYYLKQIVASEGYLLNDEIVSFEVKDSDCSVQVLEYPIYNEIEIFKVYGEENAYLAEANIEFSIYDYLGNFYDKIQTNDLGIAVIRLPYGKYKIHQENSTYGFSKVDDFEVSIVENVNETVRYSLVDSSIRCRLRISTFDLSRKKAISSDQFQYKIRKKDSLEYLEYQGMDTFSTDSRGILLFPMYLGYGDYLLEQVQADSRYLLNSEGMEITIGDSTKFQLENQEFVFDDIFYNTMIMAKLNVLTNQEFFHTYDRGYEYQKKVREKVLVDLILQEDIVVFGDVLKKKGEVVSIVTNDKGEVSIEDLYLGNYCLKELESGLEKCFSLTGKGNSLGVVEKDVEMTLILEKTDILVHDVSDYGEAIPNVLFELYDEKGHLLSTGITNDDGNLNFPQVPGGKYCLKQKKIDLEYVLQSEQICFDVTDLSQVKLVEVVNKKVVNKKILVPNTFQRGSIVGGFILIALIVMGGIFYKKKNNYNRSC